VIIASGSNGVRDVFEEIFALESLEPVDPTVAAQRHMRALKRRFNEDVTVRKLTRHANYDKIQDRNLRSF
jgi:hypothetical protein